MNFKEDGGKTIKAKDILLMQSRYWLSNQTSIALFFEMARQVLQTDTLDSLLKNQEMEEFIFSGAFT